MTELAESLKVALADTYAFSLKTQNYHWNVTGPMFSEYHAFFGALYEEVSAAIDGIAENLRTLEAFAPGSFKRFSELTTIKDELSIPECRAMMSNLYNDNKIVLASLMKSYDLAEKEKKFSVSNFIQDRITAHEKHGWMLRSYTKV